MGPFLRANYDRLDTDAFTETGADSMDLSVGAVTARSLRSSAGFRYSDGMGTGGGAMVKTSLNLSWDHEYRDQGPPRAAPHSP
jgi:outer membrane autotransporter protein